MLIDDKRGNMWYSVEIPSFIFIISPLFINVCQIFISLIVNYFVVIHVFYAQFFLYNLIFFYHVKRLRVILTSITVS
jgi:hypothetical protein